MMQNGVTDLQTETDTRTHPFIVMSSSRADPVLPWLEVFQCLNSVSVPWLGVFKCLILTTNERVE